MYVCMYVWMYGCMYVWMYVCVYLCGMYVNAGPTGWPSPRTGAGTKASEGTAQGRQEDTEAPGSPTAEPGMACAAAANSPAACTTRPGSGQGHVVFELPQIAQDLGTSGNKNKHVILPILIFQRE